MLIGLTIIMSVNIGKTKTFFVSSAEKQPCIQENTPKIKIGTTILEVSNKGKLLGVTIDNTLNLSAQVEATIKKCNSLLFLLGRINIYLDIPTRKLFFNSYILPHLDYCNSIWGNCSNDRTMKFQKKSCKTDF